MISSSLFSWGRLLDLIKERLYTGGIAVEFDCLVELLDLAGGLTIVTTAASLLMDLRIQ